jgi:protein-disulfide isomerase
MKKTNRMLIAGSTLLAVLAAPMVRAQSNEDLKKQIEELQKGQAAIKEDLDAIKQVIFARLGTPPPDVRKLTLDIGDHPVQGNKDARVTLVEFSDYQCPFCGRYRHDTAPQVLKEFVDTGKVRHVFFDMPLESIHKNAFKAAEAARCAGEQGKFWEMQDRLFENQKALEPFDPHAKALGLDMDKFDKCMATDKYATAIREDEAQARRFGANATPSFLVALAEPGNPDKVTGLALFQGAQPISVFEAQIYKALAAEKPDAAK